MKKFLTVLSFAAVVIFCLSALSGCQVYYAGTFYHEYDDQANPVVGYKIELKTNLTYKAEGEYGYFVRRYEVKCGEITFWLDDEGTDKITAKIKNRSEFTVIGRETGKEYVFTRKDKSLF
jgi:hypothetical protein